MLVIEHNYFVDEFLKGEVPAKSMGGITWEREGDDTPSNFVHGQRSTWCSSLWVLMTDPKQTGLPDLIVSEYELLLENTRNINVQVSLIIN